MIELSEGSAKGDPEVSLPSHGGEKEAFDLLRDRCRDLEGARLAAASVRPEEQAAQGTAGLQREEVRLQRIPPVRKAAETQGFVTLEWDDDAEDYVLGVPPS